jgi:hypothetical protein
MRRINLGDQQAMAYVRVGVDEQPYPAMADTGSKRSILDPELASRTGAVRLGRTGVMNIAGHKLRGELMRVKITTQGAGCHATIDAFVPNRGQPFRKGFILGMDFLQAAKMRIDAETGEAYCPADVPKRRR